MENVSNERQKERGPRGGWKLSRTRRWMQRRKGERAVYRMHIEASFHGHRRLVLLPGLDTHAVNGGKVVRLNDGEGMEPLDDGYLCIYSAACDGGGYAFRKRAQRPRARKKKRKERAKEEGDVNRCVDEIGGGDDGNKLSISNFARFSQRGNTIITILLRREFLICKEENHQSLACDFNFLNLGVKFIWNRKLKICGNDR